MSDLGKIEFVKGSLRYKQAPEKSIQLSIPLGGKLKELDEYNRTVSINLAQVYDDERQKSTLFLPSCKFQLIFSNALSGVSQTPDNPYGPFNNNLYYINAEQYKKLQVQNNDAVIPWGGLPQYNEFNFIRTDLNVDGYTSGLSKHINGQAQLASYYNWFFYITYAAESNNLKTLQYQFGDGQTITWQPINGIPFIMNKINVDGKTFWQFTCPFKHNLQVGEYVYLPSVTVVNASSTVQANRNRFEVYSLGNGFYGSEETIFNILDINFYETSVSFFESKTGLFFRIVDIDNPTESQSKYYVRRHKVLTRYTDAIITNSGFEQNAFRTVKKWESADLTPNQKSRISVKEDSQSYNVSFNNTININGLRDNLNRPLTELFFTVTNRGFFGYFNPQTNQGNALKEGWKFNISNVTTAWWERANINSNTTIPADNFGSNGRTFYRNRFLNPNQFINGDLCEWNDLTQRETVLSDCYHKFVFNPEVFNINTSVTNPLGYYYKPFFSMKIKDFSDYVEEGSKETTDGIPDYAFYSNYNNTFYWRDLYPYGFIDSDGNGTNFPFMNGRHYPYDNFIFRIIPEGTNISINTVAVQDPIVDGCE
jgi:hypothetical protein